MTLQVDDDWEGWDGDTIVKLSNGSVWRQEEYHYEYAYAYRWDDTRGQGAEDRLISPSIR